MSRIPESILIVGSQKCGKTTLAEKLIQASNRKTLIVDSDGLEKAWHKYPKISLNEVPRFKSGKARIIYDEDNPHFFKTLRRTFLNGFLVFDDAAFFLADRRAEQFKKLFMKNRQTNNDIIIIFHGMSDVPASFWTYISVMFLFNTTDAFERGDKLRYPNFEELKERVLHVRELARKNKFAKKVYRYRQ